jgi:hypothetical protein
MLPRSSRGAAAPPFTARPVHTEADAKEWNFILPNVTDSFYLSLHASLTKTRSHKNTIKSF